MIGIAVATSVLARRRHPLTRSVIAGVTAAVLSLALIAPLGFVAATDRKHDWRGMISAVASAIEHAPDTDYYVLETGYNNSPRANFYFEKVSTTVRVDGNFTRKEEDEGDFTRLDARLPEPGEGGRVVVLFTHQRSRFFTGLLAHLGSRYEQVHMELDINGRGFIVYRVGTSPTP